MNIYIFHNGVGGIIRKLWRCCFPSQPPAATAAAAATNAFLSLTLALVVARRHSLHIMLSSKIVAVAQFCSCCCHRFALCARILLNTIWDVTFNILYIVFMLTQI